MCVCFLGGDQIYYQRGVVREGEGVVGGVCVCVSVFSSLHDGVFNVLRRGTSPCLRNVLGVFRLGTSPCPHVQGEVTIRVVRLGTSPGQRRLPDTRDSALQTLHKTLEETETRANQK